jgi:hypothetical protein
MHAVKVRKDDESEKWAEIMAGNPTAPLRTHMPNHQEGLVPKESAIGEVTGR